MNKALDKLFRFLRRRFLLKHLPLPAKETLDLGCGPVPWFFCLREREKRGTRVTGFDRKAPRISCDNFHFVGGDVEEPVPFPDNSFDAVTLLAVLEHLNSPEKVLREILRVLRPGGRVFLTTPTPAAKPVLELLAFKFHLIDEKEIADHKAYFSKDTMAKILTESGFESVSMSYFEFGFNLFTQARKPL